jgi:hypothetical protein
MFCVLFADHDPEDETDSRKVHRAQIRDLFVSNSKELNTTEEGIIIDNIAIILGHTVEVVSMKSDHQCAELYEEHMVEAHAYKTAE